MHSQPDDVYLRLVPLVHQTRQQALRKIDHLRRRLGECGRRIVPKGQDTRIGNLLRQEVFQPERARLRVGLGVDGIAAKAMHRDDTVIARYRPAYPVVVADAVEAKERSSLLKSRHVARSFRWIHTAPSLSQSGEDSAGGAGDHMLITFTVSEEVAPRMIVSSNSVMFGLKEEHKEAVVDAKAGLKGAHPDLCNHSAAALCGCQTSADRSRDRQ
jgi:hypothetical protein